MVTEMNQSAGVDLGMEQVPVVTAKHINELILHYLVESGYEHSAFVFANETEYVAPESVEIPFGSLVSFLQKGLQFYAIETHVKLDGSVVADCEEPFSLVNTHKCKSKRLQAGAGTLTTAAAQTGASPSSSPKNGNEGAAVTVEANQTAARSTSTNLGDDSKMEVDPAKSSLDTTLLGGHKAEIVSCSWNPESDILASGSGDSTARIWNLTSSPSTYRLLKHPQIEGENQYIKSLDWNASGSHLATGTSDGIARIWTKQGAPVLSLSKHKGSIMCLKWNPNGNYILTGSEDKTMVVWDAQTGEIVQQYNCHSGVILDVDWRNATSFASSSARGPICICDLKSKKPTMRLEGHESEVNVIKWDPNGLLLASCSDDRTAKVWDIKNDRVVCAHTFAEHTREIYTLKWSPGLFSANPLIATGSMDTTVKLWDVNVGKCTYTLKHHVGPVITLSFSPDGTYLATGTNDDSVALWSVKTGTLIRTYQTDTGVNEVCWNNNGTRLAAGYRDGTVRVFDIKR
ncbi:Apolipoprotein A-IV [Pelomyxa schiedti]|nr:Apolipoprotein A-IV [Pelomyxa schiedti]